ncbi:MAG TPA: M48 family metalloprotease, partial [Kofleriaceae bacterium]|nr:M48 family metalloprotease [Kofleriaceae bacterium]
MRPLLFAPLVRARWLSLLALACHAAPGGRTAIAPACSPGRVGSVVIEGASAGEVAPLAVLEGTLDDPARAARIADVATSLLHARGWSDARIALSRREGCGVELHVAVSRGERGTPAALAPDDPPPAEVAYDDDDLARYVQTIADRLARGARVARAPRVVISDHDATYAASGDRIVIGRVAIAKLGSEAELAGIVAHELAHIEGDTISLDFVADDAGSGPEDGGAWLAARRDAEGVADERAVALLERAGYAPAAMARALRAVLDEDDEEHPPRAERIARVERLAAGGGDGFAGRAELLAHVDRVVVGRDTRLGTRVGRAWVVAEIGIAL